MKTQKSNGKQSVETFITIFIVTVFYLFHWICGTAAPHIIETDSWASVFTSLFNAVLFAVFFLCTFIFFKEGRSVFEKRIVDPIIQPIWKQLYLKELTLLLGIQLAVDLCVLVVSFCDFRYVSLAFNLFACVKWTFIYWFAGKGKENTLLKKTNSRLLAAGVILPPLALGIFWSIHRIIEFNTFAERLEVSSVSYSVQLMNFTFEQEVECAVFEFIIIALLCFLNHILVSKKETPFQTRALFVQTPLRLACVLSTGIIFMGFKFCVFPQGFFLWDDGFSSSVQSFSTEPEFDVVPNPIILTEKGPGTTEKIVYKENRYKVYFTQNKETVHLGTLLPTYDAPDMQYSVSGTPVFLYKNCAICFFAEDSPSLIHFKEINKTEKNDVLLATCKILLEEGNMEAFVHSAEYLSRYDPAFIEPYLLRYCERDFTATEEINLHASGYRENYIQNLALSLLN